MGKDDEQEQLRINRKRHTGNFLPVYSDFYFKKIQKGGNTDLIVTGVLIFIAINAGIASEWRSVGINIFLALAIGLFLYFLFIRGSLLEKKKMLGSELEETYVLCRTSRRKPVQVSYTQYAQEIRQGKLYYGRDGIVVGNREHRLVFPYEIGGITAQKHVKSCYRFFCEHTGLELLPLKEKQLLLLDKCFFYTRSRKRHLLSILAAAILYGLLKLGGMFENTVTAVVVSMLIAGWEMASAYALFRDTLFLEELDDQLVAEYRKCPYVLPARKKSGKVRIRLYFVVTLVLLVAYNALCLLWR